MSMKIIPVTLFGKHPSSSEYLHLGERSIFMNTVAKWVEKGFETLLQNRAEKSTFKVQHFCFFNAKEDSMICGSMKLSEDQKQRKYPLVIAVEVTKYSSVFNPYEAVAFSKDISRKIVKIFQKNCDLQMLKGELKQLSVYEPLSKQDENMASSILMSEDFSEAKLFYRPLELNDFITSMR